MTAYKPTTTEVNGGKITYNKSILKGIILLAVANVDGVAYTVNKKGEKISAESVKIDSDKDGICVDVETKVYFNYNIPDVAYEIQRSIKHNVESMSKYKISKINVHIANVEFKDEEIID